MGSFDLDNLLSMDPAGMMSFKYLRQDKYDRLPHYVVQTKPNMEVEGHQLVWVDCETYMVRKIEAFDGQGKLVASITINNLKINPKLCLLYTSDAADDLLCVDLGGRRLIKKKKPKTSNSFAH